MKDLLFAVMSRYKWHITIGVALIMIVATILQMMIGLNILPLNLLTYLPFVMAIWNAPFTMIPPVNEGSSGSVIFGRWGMIIFTLVLHEGALLTPLLLWCFKAHHQI